MLCKSCFQTQRDLSNLTQDSGIHTMSSRRDSVFSDSATMTTKQPDHHIQYRKSNSDCNINFNFNNPNDSVLDSISNHAHFLPHKNSFTCPQQSLCSVCEVQVKPCCCRREVSKASSRGGSGYGQAPSVIKCHSACAGRSRCGFGGSGYQSHKSESCSHRSRSEDRRPTSTDGKNSPKLLCAKRLLPTRHQTKNAILSILDTKEVCVEFVKKKGTKKQEIVYEVCRISPDGQRIILYEPETKVSPGPNPPPLPSSGTDQIYSFENLPEKHWKKYTYATKFVDLVRAKTPKVTYYSDKAKCLLMENLIDFEACFHDGTLHLLVLINVNSFFL